MKRAVLLDSHEAAVGCDPIHSSRYGCGKFGSVTVLERQLQGCPSVAVLQSDGQMLQVPLAV